MHFRTTETRRDNYLSPGERSDAEASGRGPMRDGIIGKARQLRERQTKAESLLWSVLRAKQLCGLKFRRQHPIPPYVADFACVARKIVVELDGGYHDYQYQYDVSRQRFLELQGWKVIRFLNEDVVNDVEAVAVSLQTRWV